jgi:LPXTG-site transpeptidase (sortase) family protein
MTIRQPMSNRVSRRLLTLIGASVALAVLAACGGKSSRPTPTRAATGASSPVNSAGATSAPVTSLSGIPTLAQASPTPRPTPTETPDDSPLAKLVIPKISVNAKLVTLGIIASTNTMDSPKNKDDVGYYDFTPRPGYAGNTVLSGHVDWFTGQTGVFWDIKKLEIGDEVDLVLQDGKTYKYKVTEAQLYDSDTAPVDDIIGDTPRESVTLITCEGVFSQSSAEYNKRRVVRAERIA